MKRLVAVLEVLVLSCMVAFGGSLLNASFEDPFDPEDWFSDEAEHWGRWGNWINRETGWSPTHSGECLLGYHHWRIEEEDSSGVFQDVEGVKIGSECTFSVYAFKDDNSNAEYIELRLEPLGGGDEIGVHLYRMGDIAKGRWKLFTVSGKNPTPGVRVLLIVKPKSGTGREGALKFDDATLATED